MTTFGSRLKNIRTSLKLSQEDFGAMFSFSKSYVSALENNKGKLSFENLVKLLVDFNVNLNYLLGGVGEMFIRPQFEQVQDEFILKVKKILKEEGLI